MTFLAYSSSSSNNSLCSILDIIVDNKEARTHNLIRSDHSNIRSIAPPSQPPIFIWVQESRDEDCGHKDEGEGHENNGNVNNNRLGDDENDNNTINSSSSSTRNYNQKLEFESVQRDPRDQGS